MGILQPFQLNKTNEHMMNRYHYLLLISLLSITACSEDGTKNQLQNNDHQKAEEPVPDSTLVLQLADDIVQALKKRDYYAIGNAAGNDGKVRFSPYALVDSFQNSMSKGEFYSTPYREMAWGNFDGSGGPIQMSVNDYFKKFVYNQDYASDPSVQIAYNRYIGSGNSINNLKEFYPNHHLVEYYYPGTAENDQMDWSCLRLVFKKEGDAFLLVGIVHDQWTI